MSARLQDDEGRRDIEQSPEDHDPQHASDPSGASAAHRPPEGRVFDPDHPLHGGAHPREFGHRVFHEHERNWLERTLDEVEAWFGNQQADLRRRKDASDAGHLRDERRGDTGWNDPFSEPEAPKQLDHPQHEFGHRKTPPDKH